MRASEASLAASVSFGMRNFGSPEGIEEDDLGEEFNERVSAFFGMFWIKGEPWPETAGD